MIEIIDAGLLTTVQDAGRPGWAHLGVSPSGAADRASWALGNRLLANPEGTASLEVLGGRLAVRTSHALAICVTGASVTVAVNGRAEPMNAVVPVQAGAAVTLGHATHGLRTYVAVRGGIDVEAELGSRSTDTLSGLGPAPLTVGDRVTVGPSPWALPQVAVAPVGAMDSTSLLARVMLGPRDDWVADALDLVRTPWTVSGRSDRIGIRLVPHGPHPTGLRATVLGRELPSEGVVRGSVQLPPGGEPIIFLADHPVTGGYPVIAVVLDADTDRLAQAVPGTSLHFSPALPTITVTCNS